MTDKLNNGDYVMNDNNDGLITVEYIEELLQNIKVVLQTQRGKFYPNKDFGKKAIDYSVEPQTEYLLNYARQALDDINGVFVIDAKINDNKLIFKIYINNEERQVELNYE